MTYSKQIPIHKLKGRKEILKHIYNLFRLITTHSKAIYKLKVIILKYPDSGKMF